MRDDSDDGRAMNVVRRATAIVVDPRTEWLRIEHESGDAVSLFIQYVAVLALIPAFAGFIGAVLVGATYPVGGTLRSPIFPALFGAIFGYVASFIVVFLLALIVDTLARRFGGQKNFGSALKLAAYSFTPAWLAGIFLLVPGLRFLTLLGLYAAFLALTGLPPLMKTPPRRTYSYAALIVVCACVLAFLVATAQQKLFAGPGGI
jgi:hypothetical protein